jgi:hypothetical protein
MKIVIVPDLKLKPLKETADSPGYNAEGEPNNKLEQMSLNAIAYMIYDNWKPVNYAAKPYLEAMTSLESIQDNYMMDTGYSVVAYFLSNANTWKGNLARAVKTELKKRLKAYKWPTREEYEAHQEKILTEKQGEDVVRVIFRVFKHNHEVIALFPDFKTGVHGQYIMSYMNIGQHGDADYHHIIDVTRLAKPEEYESLLEELKSIGYEMKVQSRINYKESEQTEKQILKETGEMSKWDIEEGGEDYEWAQQIAGLCKLIAKHTRYKFKFVEMHPFDKYQGPYAWCTINGRGCRAWGIGEMGDELFIDSPFEWSGPADLIIQAVNGDTEAIKALETNTEEFRNQG